MNWPISKEADEALRLDAWSTVLRHWPQTLFEGVWLGETPENRLAHIPGRNHGYRDVFKQKSEWLVESKKAISASTWRTSKSVNLEWGFAAEDKELSKYRDLWWKYVSASFEEVKSIYFSKDTSQWAKLVQEKWQPLAMLPITGDAEFSPSRAETVCTEFMLFMGAQGAATTRGSKDNGLDIVANNFVAQVKHLHSKVGVKAMREFLGASVSTGKVPIFFSRSGFTKEARDFAIENRMLAFSYVGYFDGETPLSRISSQVGFIGKITHESWMDADYDPYFFTMTASEREVAEYRTGMRTNRFG